MGVHDSWEQVVHNLVVETSRDVQPEPRTVAKVRGRRALLLSPRTWDGVGYRVDFEEGDVLNNVRDLQQQGCSWAEAR